MNGDQAAVTDITVWRGHGLVAGQKFMVGTSLTSIRTVTVAAATSIQFSGALTVTDGDLLVNLGNDTGTTSPNFDSSSIPIYSSLNTTTALTQSERTSSSVGLYEYWSEIEVVWEVILNSSGGVDGVVRDVRLDRVDSGIISLREVTDSHSTNPVADDEVQMYVKGDNFVWKFRDGSTNKFIFFDMNSSANPTLSYSTTEPS